MNDTVLSLEVRDLHKRFGEHEVLRGIDLTARQGEVISIIGSSGSGKSTLLRCINLLEVPERGEIHVHGEKLEMRVRRDGQREASDRRQLQRIRTRLAMVFQNFNLWSHMTVLENVIEAPIQVLGTPKREAIAQAEALLHKVGMHPDDDEAVEFDLAGKRALVIATNHGVLDVGKPTGVFASEMTVPYYAFLDAGMHVDVASPKGGTIPVDPQSLKSVLRTEADDRFLADDRFRAQVGASLPVGELDMAGYDIVYLAGGWGAAFDFGFSDALAAKVTEANALGKVIGGVCHGPLGLINATGDDGAPLVAGRHVTAVTDKQVRELGIESTPHHPEAELRKKGADFESETKFRDPLANHWVTDGNLVTGQNQNAAPMVAREMMQLVAAGAASPSGATTGAVLEPA